MYLKSETPLPLPCDGDERSSVSFERTNLLCLRNKPAEHNHMSASLRSWTTLGEQVGSKCIGPVPNQYFPGVNIEYSNYLGRDPFPARHARKAKEPFLRLYGGKGGALAALQGIETLARYFDRPILTNNPLLSVVYTYMYTLSQIRYPTPHDGWNAARL